MRPPGRLLASGREADIFEYGDRLVLRRSRQGRSMTTEARTMEYVRAYGYPVPAVEEISDDGLDLVLERIDGPVMVDAIGRRPWSVRRQGAVLADLHRRLHRLPAPDWVPPAPCGAGDRLLHLDLHPLNVLLTARGPVVIDWPRACAGEPMTDVALSWVLIAAGAIPTSHVVAVLQARGRSMLIDAFLRDVDRDALREHAVDVVAWKTQDANMTPAECQAMRAMVA